MPQKKRVVGRKAASAEKGFPSAREFTDRKGFLEAFDNAFGALAPGRHSVLVYYGVGGIGKSRLIRRLRGKEPDPPQVPAGVVHAKIDFQEAGNRLPGKALERARAQLHRQGVSFPTFDIAFAVWWKLAHPSLPLSSSELQFLDEGEIAGDIIAMLADVPVLGLVAKIPRFVGKASRSVQEWWRKRGQAELAHIAELDDPGKVAGWLPAFFGNDLKAWLGEEAGRRAALFFDTHEALLWEGRGSGESGAPPDDWLREWAAHLEGVLVVIGSRKKLRWAEPDPTWKGLIEQHLVGALAPEDAERFLEKAGVAEPGVRATIAERSEGVPQYLDLAVSTYDEIRQAEGRPPRPDEFDENLEVLLERFLTYVKDQRRQALFVLSVPGTFDYARFRDLMQTFGGGVMATRKGLKSITRFTFVDEPEPGRYALHALVREALAAMDDPDDRAAVHRHLFEQAKAALEDVDPHAVTDAQRQALCEGAAYGQAVMEPEAFLNWYRITEKPFSDAAEWRLLLPLREELLQRAERSCQLEDSIVSERLHDLAEIHWRLGHYDEAEPLYLRALRIRENSLSDDHTAVALTFNNLANLYRSQGRYDEAKPLYLEALAIRKSVFGERHPDVAETLGKLGALHREQGEYERATQFCVRSLEIREEALGVDHRDVAGSLDSLAGLYRELGEFDEAETQYLRALKLKEEVLGEDHPDTAATRNNLALVYKKLGRYDKAESFYLRSLETKRKVFGEGHPRIAVTLSNLAGLYKGIGRYDQAEVCYLRALDIREAVLPENHPRLATSLNNLAGLYRKLGRLNKAESLFLRSLRIKEEVLGESHVSVSVTINNLAVLYRERKQYGKAESFYLRALSIKEEALGKNNPKVATTLNNLAKLYRQLDRFDEAQSLCLRALQIRKEAFGAVHPRVASSLNNLAGIYGGQGHFEEALQTYKRSLSVKEVALEEDHPSVAATLHDLAQLFEDLSRVGEAETLYRRALRIREVAIGREHADTANTRQRLEALQKNAKR